jgi:hypothetical protein
MYCATASQQVPSTQIHAEEVEQACGPSATLDFVNGLFRRTGMQCKELKEVTRLGPLVDLLGVCTSFTVALTSLPLTLCVSLKDLWEHANSCFFKTYVREAGKSGGTCDVTCPHELVYVTKFLMQPESQAVRVFFARGGV